MDRSYQNWKSLKHQPLVINIAGPPRCGRKLVATLLADKLKRYFPSKRIASLHMGQIFRVLAKRALQEGLTMADLKPNLTSTDQLLNKIAGEIDFRFDELTGLSVGGLDEEQLQELDWDLDVDNIVSSVAHHEPARRTLMSVRQKIRNALENWADIVVTSEAGQHPRAQINFYLFATTENRARLFCEALRRKKVEFDPAAVLATTFQRDQEEYQVYGGPPYQASTEDPAARLRRYPGQFTALDINSANEFEIAEKILPIVLALWETFRQSRQARERLLEAFVHDRAKSGVGRLSLLMLKGGPVGGLAGELHSKIVTRIAHGGYFDYVLGSLTENRLESVIKRWSRVQSWSRELVGRIQANPQSLGGRLDLAGEVSYRADSYDHIRMERALDELMKEAHLDPVLTQTILKLRFFLDYVKQECQYIVLWRNANRKDILSAWGIDKDAANNEVQKASADSKAENGPVAEIDEQDFVKLVLVGAGDSNNAHSGSLRNLVYQELHNGSLKTMVQKRMFEGLIPADLYSILNAVHAPNGPMTDELPTELTLLPFRDVSLFTAFACFK